MFPRFQILMLTIKYLMFVFISLVLRAYTSTDKNNE